VQQFGIPLLQNQKSSIVAFWAILCIWYAWTHPCMHAWLRSRAQYIGQKQRTVLFFSRTIYRIQWQLEGYSLEYIADRRATQPSTGGDRCVGREIWHLGDGLSCRIRSSYVKRYI